MSVESDSIQPHTIENDAFRVEYYKNPSEAALFKDIESYLAEYRFQVEEYQYELDFKLSSDGKYRASGIDDGESLEEKAQRAIAIKKTQGKSIHREEADLAGIRSFDEQLARSNDGDTIVWGSPPGSAHEGFGRYGYLYVGKISSYGNSKKISMSAIRIDNQTVDQCNDFFSTVLQQCISWQHADEVVSNPLVTQIDPLSLTVAIRHSFGFKQIRENSLTFEQVMKILRPKIGDFITLIRNGATYTDLKKAFWALENYALELKGRIELGETEYAGSFSVGRNSLSFNEIINKFGSYAPPTISGSCGSTEGGLESTMDTNIFNKYANLRALFNEPDYKNDPNLCHCGQPTEPHFHCGGTTDKGGVCDHPIIVGDGTTQCPECQRKSICA